MFEKVHEYLTKEKLESLLGTDIQIAGVDNKTNGFAYLFNNDYILHIYERAKDKNAVICYLGIAPNKSHNFFKDRRAYIYRYIDEGQFIDNIDDKKWGNEFKYAQIFDKEYYPIFKIDEIVKDLVFK